MAETETETEVVIPTFTIPVGVANVDGLDRLELAFSLDELYALNNDLGQKALAGVGNFLGSFRDAVGDPHVDGK